MQPNPLIPACDDDELVRRIVRRDNVAFEAMMRQYNRKLFRIARSILKDDAEAEDALQEAYFDAYRNIESFRGDARLATWLTRLVINQALARLRKRRRDRVVVPFNGGDDPNDGNPDIEAIADTGSESPEAAATRSQMRRLLERKIDELPVAFRSVFVMREVEELSVEETAECLSIPAATVRTRLFRARAMLREALAREIDLATPGVYDFGGARCDRIVAAVFARLPESGLLPLSTVAMLTPASYF